MDLFSSSPRRRRAFTLLRGQRLVFFVHSHGRALLDVLVHELRAARLRHHGASRLPRRRDGAAIERGGGACEGIRRSFVADHCQEAEDEEEDELKMGNAFRKGSSDQRSGLTDGEKRLIRNSWRKFCEQNPDYGVRIFISMFAKHPEYLQMFPRFRDKELQTLRDDAKFRAHACAVGHQLSAIVECIEDDEVFIELIRKNAANHLPRAGVSPSNFESLFAAALEQMVASNKALMTPATMRAWEKLFKVS
ncbi:hypothetical protein HPB51_023239 [Rhipicephalus microplus]|uniref:Globin domain-containing protein n=1 Tax=Rhipicephalus microplus TaxID=6941 RepID=A0A9J6ECT5_RHIMP|nr:hypothetical protein HPB51_023239 [Rhipicephalus microplus]